jgi:hypothetical protein
MSGKVIDGMDVVKTVEGVGSGSGATSKQVKIAACGELDPMGTVLRGRLQRTSQWPRHVLGDDTARFSAQTGVFVVLGAAHQPRFL